MVTDYKNAALYIPLKESHDEISRYPSQAAPSREPSPVVRTPKQVRVKKIRTNHSARVIHRISTDEHERRSLCTYRSIVENGGNDLIDIALMVRLCSPFASQTH